MKELTGGCLCGEVTYSIPDKIKYSGYCHCSGCRKFSGSSFSVFAGVTQGDLKINSGENQIKYFEESESTILGFCQNCGSSLFGVKPQTGLVHIRMGSLNDAPSLRPQVHVFVGSKADWDIVSDDLPQFEAGPPERKSVTEEGNVQDS